MMQIDPMYSGIQICSITSTPAVQTDMHFHFLQPRKQHGNKSDGTESQMPPGLQRHRRNDATELD
jgi:hypothetical protein